MRAAIDFAAHAKSLGAESVHVQSLTDLELELAKARNGTKTTVIVIDTDPVRSTDVGGHWWDVAVPEISDRDSVKDARANYEQKMKSQFLGD